MQDVLVVDISFLMVISREINLKGFGDNLILIIFLIKKGQNGGC